MARQKHSAVTFIIAIVAVYFVVRYWTSIQAAAGSVVNAVSGGTVPSPMTNLNMSSGAPGDPAFAAAFGGSNAGFSGNLFTGPLGRMDGSLGLNPGFYEGTGSVGDARAGIVPNSFGNCSTNPRDGKALCQ